MKQGKLFLIPTPLGEGANQAIPQYVIEILHRLSVFIFEKGKTGRAFIKSTGPKIPFAEMTFFELNKRTEAVELPEFLAPAAEGHDIGLMSEAGCPGVADPGAVIVEMAHKKGIEVVPLVGPSSILLALMASGMDGQSFAFQGYLPQKKPDLVQGLKKLEQLSRKQGQSQIFIETPYRNTSMIEAALETLSAATRFCVAANLTLENEWIFSGTIAEWRKKTIPDLHKQAAIFLLQA